ncbi:MAG: aspartate aminotransferase family protein, partial [Desulfatiglandales bacterium]
MSDTIEMADKYIFNTYKRYPIAISKGKGTFLWDEEGRQYLDFIGGIAVCNLGHANPVLAKVMYEQALNLVHTSNLFYTRPQAELAKLLVENSFGDKVFFCNSGAEANEAAIKLCRRYSFEKYGKGRHVIISTYNSFHGRTLATLSATGQEKVRYGFEPFLEGFRFVPYGDLNSLLSQMDQSVCGVILEPIQGEGGVILPPENYLKEVREECIKRDIILIFDEVQVGMGRTGRLFAHQHFGVSPDIMTLAKAMANGLPMGAMLATESIAGAFGPGAHASTFGGTPLVSQVALHTLKLLLEEDFLSDVYHKGEYLKRGLRELQAQFGIIKEIRGMGLIVGAELDRAGESIVNLAMKKGLLINCTHDTVLR